MREGRVVTRLSLRAVLPEQPVLLVHRDLLELLDPPALGVLQGLSERRAPFGPQGLVGSLVLSAFRGLRERLDQIEPPASAVRQN